MSNFTPGPWKQARSEGYIIVDNGIRPSTVIAHAWSVDIHKPEEWKANARLIAAAPDMYAVLKEIASGPCCETEGCSADNPYCDVSTALAVLALVDGDS